MAFEQFLTIGFWIYIIISSIISAIAIYIGVKITKEVPDIMRAILVAVIANIVAVIGILGVVANLVPIPFAYIILSALIWILLIKFFFKMKLMNAIVVGLIAFVVTYAMSFFGITAIINNFFT